MKKYILGDLNNIHAQREGAFDVAPFALPNSPRGELRFEEPRDLSRVLVEFSGDLPATLGLSYLAHTWPATRLEEGRELESPFAFGWTKLDDWFNVKWRRAAVVINRQTACTAIIRFRPLTAEFPEMTSYDVIFRRTLGIRLEVARPETVKTIRAYTVSPSTRTRIRVELSSRRRVPSGAIRLEGYNVRIVPLAGARGFRNGVRVKPGAAARFEVEVEHMTPVHRYCGDDGHVRFVLPNDAFTISLGSLDRCGPIWFKDAGFYIARADDPMTLSKYRASCRGKQTVTAMVKTRPEQTYGGAFWGQPRPHAVAYSLGWKHARQRFWLEPNGDVVLMKRNVTAIVGSDTARYTNAGDARFFFGLEHWQSLGRWPAPAPELAWRLKFRRGSIDLEQHSVAVPLAQAGLAGEPHGDETIICLLRFRFTNTGQQPEVATLSIRHSQHSFRSINPYQPFHDYLESPSEMFDDWLVPRSSSDKLRLRGRGLYGTWKGKPVLRCRVDSTMHVHAQGAGVTLTRRLRPGERCEALVKIPFIRLDPGAEQKALAALDWERSRRRSARFWWNEQKNGATLRTPVPQLDALHQAHLTHVQVTDSAMPSEPRLINTSVGTSTYGNFGNESCMICQELDQRGKVEDARRRLAVWVKYQGTVALPGNFTDSDGVFHGAGGFEGLGYNQHHGWILWRLAEHFLYTRDQDWFRSVLPAVLRGCEWIFRQRRQTMKPLPHSRGWEYGFLPAGSLEDVTDFSYWLSTNALTWRAVETVAVALNTVGHAEALRIRREADAYARDLRRGFEIQRQHTPLVRLRNGVWTPHYPSRLYHRGRDVGWIRETLEGSVYLLLSGLYKPNSRQARWILDDYQDNRYLNPPFGYPLGDAQQEWYDRGGFSMQPNLLAGLMPYLDRDEPELYIWMFFNAFSACYREEIQAMVEHPMPVLGYSNSAHFKTSDQANAVMWLRAMFVYAKDDLLHLGRAIPRAWFTGGNAIGVENVRTVFGAVSVTYHVAPDERLITARIALSCCLPPERFSVRFRHPRRKPIQSVTINGKRCRSFNAATGDVTLVGWTDRLIIQVRYS